MNCDSGCVATKENKYVSNCVPVLSFWYIVTLLSPPPSASVTDGQSLEVELRPSYVDRTGHWLQVTRPGNDDNFNSQTELGLTSPV